MVVWDENALNYNALATNPSNTCQYQEGCTIPDAFNYDETAIVDDGTCLFPQPDEPTVYRYGCSDPLALNYDPEVTEPEPIRVFTLRVAPMRGLSTTTLRQSSMMAPVSSSKSGLSQQYRYGCSDPLALNYDPEVTTPTNTCVYPEGCTNDAAWNYDETAIVDDGSCEFPDVPTVDITLRVLRRNGYELQP